MSLSLMMRHHALLAAAAKKGGGGNFVRIGQHDYPYVKIGNLYWTTENLYENTLGSVWMNNDEATAMANKYGKLYPLSTTGSSSNFDALNAIKAILPRGWRFPNVSDLRDLTSISSNSNHYLKYYGNQTKFDGILCGYKNKDGNFIYEDRKLLVWSDTLFAIGVTCCNIDFTKNNDVIPEDYSRFISCLSVRICKDA